MEQRDSVLRGLRRLDRRCFLKVAAASAGRGAGQGSDAAAYVSANRLRQCRDRQESSVGVGKPGSAPFRFAYISDTHLYERTLNQRFVRAAVKAVEDVNALDPQPDFVLFGGDLAQLGRRKELDLGRQILAGAQGAG